MGESCWRTTEEGRQWQADLQHAVSGIDAVTRLLAEADRSARAGRAAIDRSVSITRQAYDALPIGTVLGFAPAPPVWGYQIRLTESGWVRAGSGDPVDADWVQEWWSRDALRIVRAVDACDHIPPADIPQLLDEAGQPLGVTHAGCGGDWTVVDRWAACERCGHAQKIVYVRAGREGDNRRG